jgi:hypothetical protein
MLVLVFFKDFVKGLSFDSLPETYRPMLLTAISQMLDYYCKHQVGRFHQLKAAHEEEMFDDLCLILRLLSVMLDAEYEGFGNIMLMNRI